MKVSGKCGSVRVRLIPAPRGTRIVGAPTTKKILGFAGIKDCFSSSTGSTKTRGNFMKVCHVNYMFELRCFIESARLSIELRFFYCSGTFRRPQADLWVSYTRSVEGSRFHEESFPGVVRFPCWSKGNDAYRPCLIIYGRIFVARARLLKRSDFKHSEAIFSKGRCSNVIR